MPKAGRRKSTRLHKPSEKTLTRSVSPPPAKPPKKRAKPTKFIDPRKVLAEEEEEEEEAVSEPPQVPVPVKDVSSMVFTINKCCLLDKESVWNDADFVMLGEFSYREFHQQTIRRVSKAAEKDRREFEWTLGQATITSEKAKIAEAISIEVEDESGWNKVEQGVERWMREKNKGGVTVKLSIMYTTIKARAIGSPGDDAPVLKKVLIS
jgi:hypothetical protein